MAFTIRELSDTANSNLKKLQENNPAFFKTKTKAIDFVLSNYYSNKSYMAEIEKQNQALKEQYQELKQKLDDVKFALSILKKI